jgi:hypothetical protein
MLSNYQLRIWRNKNTRASLAKTHSPFTLASCGLFVFLSLRINKKEYSRLRPSPDPPPLKLRTSCFHFLVGLFSYYQPKDISVQLKVMIAATCYEAASLN